MDKFLNFMLNHLGSVMVGSGGVIAAVMSLIQVSKIQINPWTWIAKIVGDALKAVGNALNAGMMDEIKDMKTEIKEIKSEQKETQKKLDAHIEKSEEQKADDHKSRVLRFNNELVRGLGHTEEDYNEILDIIWKYETYCKTHPNYQNNRLPHAIKNVERMYDEMLRTNGFLKIED